MLNKKAGLFVLLATLTAGDLFAGSLTNYAVGDVLLCFRKSGGANDLVVDAGTIATFTNTTINQRIPVSNFTGAQLALVGTNSVLWSAFSWFDDTVTPASSQWTLFMTRGRVANYVQTTPYSSYGAGVQQFTITDMQPVPLGTKDAKSYNGANTANAVIEPDDNVNNPNPTYTTGQSYDYAVNGNSGNADFDGSFPGGNVEKATPSTFTTSGAVARSDFYWIPPTGAVKLLGYFELNTNGVMTFVAKPTTPTVTTVAASSITASGAQLNSTVNPNSDNTTLYFQYGLTTSYGSTSSTSAIGQTSGSYGLPVSSLASGTTYHFRVVAYNSVGTNYGSDLTFVTTGGGAVTPPVITSITRSGGVSYITFTTGSSGTYTLRGTNSAGLGAAKLTWPAIASVGGDGAPHTLTDPAANANQFYLISAQ